MDKDYSATFLEEYRIIQSKIDKIGEFKFKVKGWSITLLTGLIVSVYADKVSAVLFLVMWLIPFLFQCLETEQNQYSGALGNRAMDLEKIIDRLSFERDEPNRKKESIDMAALSAVGGSPRIAVTLRNISRLPFSTILQKNLQFKTNVFYYFQYVFIIISAIVFIYKEVFVK